MASKHSIKPIIFILLLAKVIGHYYPIEFPKLVPHVVTEMGTFFMICPTISKMILHPDIFDAYLKIESNWAVQQSDNHYLEKLLRHGLNPNDRDLVLDITLTGNIDMARLLLKYGSSTVGRFFGLACKYYRHKFAIFLIKEVDVPSIVYYQQKWYVQMDGEMYDKYHFYDFLNELCVFNGGPDGKELLWRIRGLLTDRERKDLHKINKYGVYSCLSRHSFF
jgi:hypothetical protein